MTTTDGAGLSKPVGITGPYQHIGFPQFEGEVAFDGVGTTYNTALGDKALDTTKDITTLSSAATGRFIRALDDCAGVMLKFFGTDANNETGTARVTLWRWVQGIGDAKRGAWEPSIACQADLILGDQPVSGVGLTDAFWVDTITVLPDLVPGALGAQVLEPGTPDGTPSVLMLETFGALAIEVELTRASKTAAALNAVLYAW